MNGTPAKRPAEPAERDVYKRQVFVSIAETVRRRWLTAVLAVLWILFLPNAFYLLTDLIHVPKGMSTAGAGGVIYSTSIHQWIQLLVIGVGAVMGTLMGLESLRQVRGWLASVRGSLFSWCAVGAVSLLCGVGIYIGRFLRFNSWEDVYKRQGLSIGGTACGNHRQL